MQQARIYANQRFVVGSLDRRIFGSFVEHLGRCVYGGIFEPNHPTADADGFRGDVLELCRELGVTVVRYPGGNFVSGYKWEDGVGPKDNRPRKLDLAWATTESNQFGTNEFVAWCRKANAEPMFAVNLGNRGPQEAADLLEYCNHPAGTHLSDLRRSHGFEEPHEIKFWCLGNEMDGVWQIGQKTGPEYGKIARAAAKLMRRVNPDLVLAACGSANRNLATYAKWEYEVLSECFEDVDFISLHAYFRNTAGDIESYFTSLDDLNLFIKEVVAIADAVAAQKRSNKQIMLSLDEWNVWYRARSASDMRAAGWPEAPAVLEEIYNFEDALVVGGALIVMMNNADRVRTACLAQLVNAIGAIFTETGGSAWRQTIFHPFAAASRWGHGEILDLRVDCGGYSTERHAFAPYVMAAMVRDAPGERATLFLLNRNKDEAIDIQLALEGIGSAFRIEEASELHHPDPKASNDRDTPDRVAPVAHPEARIEKNQLNVRLKPLSWNVVTLLSTGNADER